MPSNGSEVEYPLGANRPDLIRTPSGLALDDLSLESLSEGRIPMGDVRIAPATLLLQAEVARRAGREALAANLERAAELARIPDDVILALYTSLRPGRATVEELGRWVTRLEEEFEAPTLAGYVREAADAYHHLGIA